MEIDVNVFPFSDHFKCMKHVHIQCSYTWFKLTIMILSFRTVRSGQTLQTQIRLLLFQRLHCLPSVCIFWTHYPMVKPPFSKFRVITANFSGVCTFRIFTGKFRWDMCNISAKATRNRKVGLKQKRDFIELWLICISNVSMIFVLP